MASENVSRRSSELKLKLTGRFFRRATIITFAGLAVVAAIWWWAQQSPINRGNKALNAAYRFSRPLEERISGFDYATFAQVRGSESDKVDSVARAQAERFFLDAAEDHKSKTLHALGRYYLAQGKIKEAEDQFDLALQGDSQNAQLHNDQGVTLMAKSRTATGEAESGEEIEQLAIALEHVNRALELNPNLPEAVFNRALLYNQMLLPQQARDAWQQYLELDTASRWADEARRNLQRLEETQLPAAPPPDQIAQSLREALQRGDDEQVLRLIRQSRDRISSVAVGELLDGYLAALASGNKVEAGQNLATLTYLGDLEARLTGDRFTHNLTSFYGRVAPVRQADLRTARGWMKTGIVEFEKGLNSEGGRANFTRAKRLFDQLGNVGESLQAEYQLARTYRQASELPFCSTLYERLEQVCARSGYQWLLMQILIAQAQLQGGLANHSEVIERSQRGLQMAQSSADANSVAVFLLQSAEAHYSLGDVHQSLKLYRQGLTLMNKPVADLQMRWAHYMSIGLPLNVLGRHTAAAAYQQESLYVARALGNPTRMCLSHINLGLTYGFQGKHGEATENAQSAFDTAQNIPNINFRTEHLALSSLKLGQLHSRAGNFAAAIESFNQAIRLYGELASRQAFKYSAHKGRLVASLAQGEPPPLPELEGEIKTVLGLFEEYRVKIREESHRNKFFDLEQNIYDIAIDFWYTRKGDEFMAFELAERCRARSLLDLVSAAPRPIQEAGDHDLQPGHVAPPMTLAEIQARMPEQTQLVQYAVLKDRLLIWVLSGSQSLVVREQPISESELGSLVMAYLRAADWEAAGAPAQMTEAARQLHRLLIQPIASLLDKRKQLCLVPDKMLNQLPFSSLVDSDSGRFLVEDFTLTFAPSATMFVICSAAAAAKENVKVEKLLSLGDPTFDRAAFPLPYLLSQRREAADVAVHYHSLVLTGPQATKRRLVNEVERHDVLHLALHCVVDERSPMRSKLLLAKDYSGSEAEGVLQAYEIYRLPLERLRLVVLAACRSGVERYYGGEGMIGISRPFIAKGIPLVVASLWEVDSQATALLMTRFHEYRKLKSLPTAEALRQAQLSMLHGAEAQYHHPYYWAGFESIGGHTRF